MREPTGTAARRPYADPVLAGLTAFGVALVLWFLAGPGGSSVSWAVQTGMDVLVAVFAVRLAAATAGQRHARRFWRAVAVAGMSCTIGDAYQTTLAVLGLAGHTPSPVQTTFVVGGMVVAMVTMVFHPLGGAGRQRLRLWLDAATVLAAVAVFAWYFVLADALSGDRAVFVGAAATSAIMLLTTVGLLKLLLGGTAPFARGPGIVASLGVGGTAIAASTVTLLTGTSDPGVIYVAQLLPCLLLPVALRVQELQTRGPGTTAHGNGRSSRLPYVAVAAVQLLLLAALVGRHADLRVWGVTAGAVLITGLVLARQMAAFTDNERLLTEVDRQREWFRSLVQHASDLTLVVGADGIVRFATPASRGVLGIADDAVTGTALDDLVLGDDRPALAGLRSRLAASPGTDARAELRFRHADGSYRWLQVVGVDLTGSPGVGGVVLNARDVTEARALHEELRHRATHDALTGLADRSVLEQRLAVLTAADQVSVLLIDLDGFKPVNDRHGHHAGDQVLVAVADRLRALTGPDGLSARLGGDEFAVLLPHAGAGQARELADRLTAGLGEPIVVAGTGQVRIGASVGTATGAGPRAERLLREADAAMYRTKAVRKAGALVA